MKMRIAGILTALLLFVMTGCGNHPVKNSIPEQFSFSESKEQTSDTKQLPAAEEKQEVDSESIPTHNTEPSSKDAQISENNSEAQVQTTDKPVSEETIHSFNPPSIQVPGTKPAKTEGSSVQVQQPVQFPTERKEPEPKVSKEPEPEVSQEPMTAEVKQPEEELNQSVFDIDYWISYAKDYAGDIGLNLNEEAVYCWDNPIPAGTRCKYTERDIADCLNRYSKDEEITDVWIWTEKINDNSFEIYIGYA